MYVVLITGSWPMTTGQLPVEMRKFGPKCTSLPGVLPNIAIAPHRSMSELDGSLRRSYQVMSPCLPSGVIATVGMNWSLFTRYGPSLFTVNAELHVAPPLLERAARIFPLSGPFGAFQVTKISPVTGLTAACGNEFGRNPPPRPRLPLLPGPVRREIVTAVPHVAPKSVDLRTKIPPFQ